MANSGSSIMNPGGTANMGIAIPDSTYIPTAYEATIGNVWQTSTHKRDKILEFKGELNASPLVVDMQDSAAQPLEHITLDLLATERQKLDLYLVDGLHLIVQHVEDSIPISTIANDTTSLSLSSPTFILHDLMQRLEHKIETEMDHTEKQECCMSESEWNRILVWLQQEIETTLKTTSTTTTPITTTGTPTLHQQQSIKSQIYHPIRDYMNVSSEPYSALLQREEFRTFLQEQEQSAVATESNTSTFTTVPNNDDESTISTTTMTTTHSASSALPQHSQIHSFQMAVVRYQLYTTLSIVQQLQKSWNILTTLTDQDTDRAAVKPQSQLLQPQNGTTSISDSNTSTTTAAASPPPKSLPIHKLRQVIQSYLIPNNQPTAITNNNQSNDRIQALWSLIDKDNDGLIDQVEMNHICTIAVQATQSALRQFVQEVIDVIPMDQPLQNDKSDQGKGDKVGINSATKKLGWRQARRQKLDKTLFMKRLNKALQNHLHNEMELSHRLRCIYAWANKKHQNNRLDSILVQEESGGVMTNVVGRKRYVELYPKIAIHEFREVQAIHFPQLDGIGQEYLKSFREDLWVVQGIGRQNRELQRDCALFLLGVCCLDLIVLSL
jgi:hypothetical protein